MEGKVIAWRGDIHKNLELFNREFKNAEKMQKRLLSLGIAVQTGVVLTPDFGIDGNGLLLGVKALTQMSLDYLSQ
ncbi:MAG: hypothetical protein AAGA86_11520 [Bacteroidota bacterium]